MGDFLNYGGLSELWGTFWTMGDFLNYGGLSMRWIGRAQFSLLYGLRSAEQRQVICIVRVACTGNALFYGLPQNQISRLQPIQNTAARVVTLSRKSCHITPILKELYWLPVSHRIVFKLVLIVHKSINNIAPIYISELLKVYTPSRNLRSSNMSLLNEPTSKRTWVIDLFLSRLRDSGIIFQLNLNLACQHFYFYLLWNDVQLQPKLQYQLDSAVLCFNRLFHIWV